jgi:hypothetical protein
MQLLGNIALGGFQPIQDRRASALLFLRGLPKSLNSLGRSWVYLGLGLICANKARRDFFSLGVMNMMTPEMESGAPRCHPIGY